MLGDKDERDIDTFLKELIGGSSVQCRGPGPSAGINPRHSIGPQEYIVRSARRF